MRRRAALVVFAIALFAASCRSAPREPELVVFAAVSTSDALREVARAFSDETHVVVRFSFGASSDLARQIDAGAPADVFLSADRAKMDALERAGRVRAEDRRDLLSNALVVVVPRDSKRSIAAASDLAGLAKVAIADTATVPIGIYARSWLERAGAWDEVRPKVVTTLDARATLAAVEAAAVEAGIVYRTDAMITSKVKVAYEVPRDATATIVYPVARVAASTHPYAKAFVDFLFEPRARDVFKRCGFIALARVGG